MLPSETSYTPHGSVSSFSKNGLGGGRLARQDIIGGRDATPPQPWVLTRAEYTSIDPIELIREKEVLDALEETIDACEDVMDLIRSVVVKNG